MPTITQPTCADVLSRQAAVPPPRATAHAVVKIAPCVVPSARHTVDTDAVRALDGLTVALRRRAGEDDVRTAYRQAADIAAVIRSELAGLTMPPTGWPRLEVTWDGRQGQVVVYGLLVGAVTLAVAS